MAKHVLDLAEIETAEREQAARDAAEAFQQWQAGNAPRPDQWRFTAASAERAVIEGKPNEITKP